MSVEPTVHNLRAASTLWSAYRVYRAGGMRSTMHAAVRELPTPDGGLLYAIEVWMTLTDAKRVPQADVLIFKQLVETTRADAETLANDKLKAYKSVPSYRTDAARVLLAHLIDHLDAHYALETEHEAK